jgi:hypothetical protein
MAAPKKAAVAAPRFKRRVRRPGRHAKKLGPKVR